jgi:hypothetical protein
MPKINTVELNALEEQTNTITFNLADIDKFSGEYDLGELETRSTNVAGSLYEVDEALGEVGDLDAIEGQLDRVLARLEQIKKLQDEIEEE